MDWTWASVVVIGASVSAVMSDHLYEWVGSSASTVFELDVEI